MDQMRKFHPELLITSVVEEVFCLDSDCIILRCHWNEYNPCLAQHWKTCFVLWGWPICPTGTNSQSTWLTGFLFKILQQCQMTDVFAVLFLMDGNRSFSVMLALADKDLIFAWRVKWGKSTTAFWQNKYVFFCVFFSCGPRLNSCTNAWCILDEKCCSTFSSNPGIKKWFIKKFTATFWYLNTKH